MSRSTFASSVPPVTAVKLSPIREARSLRGSSVDMSVEARQLLDDTRELFGGHVEPSDDLLLLARRQVEEGLDQVAVDEAVRVGGLPVVDEGAPRRVREPTHPLDDAGERRLHLCEPHVQLLRKRGDHADHAVDGAVQHRRQRLRARLAHLHGEGAAAEAVDELAEVELAHHLQPAPLLLGGRVGPLASREEVERVLRAEEGVVVEEGDRGHPVGVDVARQLGELARGPLQQRDRLHQVAHQDEVGARLHVQHQDVAAVLRPQRQPRRTRLPLEELQLVVHAGEQQARRQLGE
mmetsp:Transcript_47714/g.154222  ORF Transcript_47714/g.154222 Transcript_47714/m.154222 type:complete len:293 (+) Transcript_47714:74-952(+)